MAVKKDALVKYQQRGSVALAMWVSGRKDSITAFEKARVRQN